MARIDRKPTAISVLAAIGVRRDGQKILLASRNLGGKSRAVWQTFLDDLDARGLKALDFVIVDGAPGLEALAIAAPGGADGVAPDPSPPCVHRDLPRLAASDS